MNRIITRGLGPTQLLITRGYGFTGAIVKIYREVLRLVSKVTTRLGLVSQCQKKNCV
jgi:hypothetical protein